MTRHLLLRVAASLLSAAACAQEVPQASPPAPQPPPSTAPAPDPQSACTLHDGTPVKLRLTTQLDSRTAKEGDEIPFDVINDIVVGGVTVLRRGSPVTGVVIQAAAAKTMGRAGRLNFVINDITLRDGAKLPVRAFNKTSGENRTGEMIGMMIETPMVAAPFFLLMHGTNTSFPRGTEINAFVNGDLQLNLASFGGPLSTDSANDRSKFDLQLSSTPSGAQVQIDGAIVGVTPLNLSVTSGKHEIAITKSGYSAWTRTLDLNGNTNRLEAVLESRPAQ